MLRLVLILIISFIISGSSHPKMPIVIFSQKATMDKVLNIITYEGAVKIDFQDYNVVTEKMIISSYNTKGSKVLDKVEFPSTTKIIKKDLSETIIVPKAIYYGKDRVIKSEGEIYVEKNNLLFSTASISIELGSAKNFEQLRW